MWLEQLSEEIKEDFGKMRRNEEEMSSTNESTNALVVYFGLFSMLCLVVLASGQILYLRKYFKSKKLID